MGLCLDPDEIPGVKGRNICLEMRRGSFRIIGRHDSVEIDFEDIDDVEAALAHARALANGKDGEDG